MDGLEGGAIIIITGKCMITITKSVMKVAVKATVIN